VERTFAWIHAWRRLGTCYDRRPDMHEAALAIACCIICWRHLERSF
jgi:transposase